MKKSFGSNVICLPNNDWMKMIIRIQAENGEFVMNPINNVTKSPVSKIGVDNEQFTIKFDPSGLNGSRYAIGVYFDDININQSDGIKLLSDIPEHDRHNMFNHRVMIGKGIQTLNRYNQISGQNRTFVFGSENGVSQLGNGQNLNSIRIYVWVEHNDFMGGQHTNSVTRGGDNSRSIGAGNATNEAYGSTTTLNNPEFLGVATILYETVLNGNTLVFPASDPMDKVSNSYIPGF